MELTPKEKANEIVEYFYYMVNNDYNEQYNKRLKYRKTKK